MNFFATQCLIVISNKAHVKLILSWLHFDRSIISEFEFDRVENSLGKVMTQWEESSSALHKSVFLLKVCQAALYCECDAYNAIEL